MIEVNIEKLNDLLVSYDNFIKQLDDNNFELISEFNIIKKYWHDQRCINMYSSFELEKNRIIKNVDNIKKQEDLYRYIMTEYKSLGNKIRCDLDKKDTVIEKINLVIENLNTIIGQYNNIGDIGFYRGAHKIRSQKKKLQNVLDSFNNMKDELIEKYHEISEIESNIQEKLTDLKIECFSYNNYESEI